MSGCSRSSGGQEYPTSEGFLKTMGFEWRADIPVRREGAGSLGIRPENLREILQRGAEEAVQYSPGGAIRESPLRDVVGKCSITRTIGH